jgi:NIPSNAP
MLRPTSKHFVRRHRYSGVSEVTMLTVCIRYTLDIHKLADFERYARNWPEPIRRCGGELVGYYLPTKIAGPTNFALALINFPNLAAYERYRDALMKDADASANVEFADNSGCVLLEDRTIMRQVS